jgi:transposase-like protein
MVKPLILILMAGKRRKLKPLRTPCPYCRSYSRQMRNGRHRSGSAKVRCNACKRNYTLWPKINGYPFFIQFAALSLYARLKNYRLVARHCGVHHQTVINWVKRYRGGFIITTRDLALLQKHKLSKTFEFNYSLYGKEKGNYWFPSLRH